MFSFKVVALIILVGLVNLNILSIAQTLPDGFEEYKLTFNKVYNSISSEAYARFCYNYNRNLINIHNALYKSGIRTFGLRENQFTDMRLMRFNTLFPPTTQLTQTFNTPQPEVSNQPPAIYDPCESGINITVSNQGIKCNSGWAYATAKSIELLQAYRTGNTSPLPLSAQNLIDCAGGANACRNQVPQMAFDFLTQHMQDLYLDSEYVSTNDEGMQGMCLQPNAATILTNLSKYAILKDGDDEALMRYVAAGYPVVIEFNPTSFEFMHYAEGVFQQPNLTNVGSHYMLVVGYGLDAQSGLNYWLVLNSFGENWGEQGFIKIARNANKPLTKSAIFPLDTALNEKLTYDSLFL